MQSAQREFNLVLSFGDLEQLQRHVVEMEEFIGWKEARVRRAMTDRRGKHIGEVHRRAKKYRSEHPGLTYREAMKASAAETKGAASPPTTPPPPPQSEGDQ
jgi:hypothetical protein